MMFFAVDFGNGLALQNIGRLLKVGMRMRRGTLVALEIAKRNLQMLRSIYLGPTMRVFLVPVSLAWL